MSVESCRLSIDKLINVKSVIVLDSPFNFRGNINTSKIRIFAVDFISTALVLLKNFAYLRRE